MKKLPFHPVISNWFKSQFSEASPPQKKGWPVIAAGKNVLILAPTGSGKTLAAFLWCLDELFRMSLQKNGWLLEGVHTLYVSPLKALNNDIHRNLQTPLKGLRKTATEMDLPAPEIRALVRTGDTPSHVRQSMVKKPPHILITTPESLYLLLTSARGREIFRGLRYVIVDEIHALCGNKRGVHLSLSLERLMTLCRHEPVRIGLSATQRPLKRIASFLGGQKFDEIKNRPQPRPVTIVDCGQRKNLDLKVLAPVKSFSDLPESTVWPAVIQKLYDLICSHRTTLVFAHMRAQTERIARQLNELHREQSGNPNSELALAHHGSISREVRHEIEARLKAARIPAVIATGSLELGIDIGSIDLVIQLEAPRSVTSALQRVGRSGHLLKATSKGRIIPMYPSDLDDALTITQCMLQGEIEETTVPENCLDVLAQQIVAEVALRTWSRADLFHLVKQSYCYRNLSEAVFNDVVAMLAGRYTGVPLQALKPRLAWDKVNDRLISRRGARLLAATNGGTIPDRGYYSVYLNESNTKLGEMEEEFVFESRVGHVFFLGNNEWRIDSIHQDRIVVSPVRAVKPRAPFWKGDILYRDFATSQKVGAFRREWMENSAENNRQDRLNRWPMADADTIDNLQAYLQRQCASTRWLPTDKQLIGEWFRDIAEEPHFILHTCFGARVNGAWAIALSAALEKHFSVQVQYAFNDDGIILRTLDSTEPLPVNDLLHLSAKEVEKRLLEALVDTPMFSVRFRYNAARALILPRSQPHKRIPLWLQRLRAADLLQIVRQFPDFPIVIETYRDCLHDLFDLPALRQVLTKINAGEMSIKVVQTPSPSPMSSGLMFNFLSSNMYEVDRARLPAQAAAVSSVLLAEILQQEAIPTVVTPELVTAAEARWQHTSPEYRARDAEGLFAIIEKLAPVSDAELWERSQQDPADWLQQMQAENRICKLTGKNAGWVPVTEKGIFADHPDEDIICERIRRFLRVRGAVTSEQIHRALNFPEDRIKTALTQLHSEKEIVSGRLIVGTDTEFWCDRHNFAELYRRAIAARRTAAVAVKRGQFWRFQMHWHNISRPAPSVLEMVKQYAGYRFPVSMFEREIIGCRVGGENLENLPRALESLRQLIAEGDVVVRAHRETDSGPLRLEFLPRATGSLFANKKTLLESSTQLKEPAASVNTFLKENGASLVRDIIAGTELSTAGVQEALKKLVEMGLASCDNYRLLLAVLKSGSEPSSWIDGEAWLPASPPVWSQSRRRTRGRGAIRKQVETQVQLGASRWFLTSSFAALGKELSDHERAQSQARLLLQRYGILVKEWYRREQGLLPWYQLFQILKRLEWQGEIRRGYFIEGLSGVQFALPEAVELLETLQTESLPPNGQPILLSTADPALPLGGAVDWNIKDARGNKLTVVRSPSNHLLFLDATPALYSENYGARLWTINRMEKSSYTTVVQAMKTWLHLPANLRPRKHLEIGEIDGQPAVSSPLAAAFLQNGYEQKGKNIILWPSGV
ncbi:MAG: DEAD/DEAH box helicase [bacterium]